jgi:hypothetical protein
LPNAIGLRSAASIVYRCQSQHLFAQSEFIDFRLGCVLSAEELFGKDSTEARVTAQAFDAVEIYATPELQIRPPFRWSPDLILHCSLLRYRGQAV